MKFAQSTLGLHPERMTLDYVKRGITRLEVCGPVAVCGDVHGRLDLLDRLLCALPPGVPLIHCGDLIDRGPDSNGVLQRMIDVGARGVRGNHEEWMSEWLLGKGIDAFGHMLGRETLQSYGIDERASLQEINAAADVVPAGHRALLDSLPLVLDLVVDEVPYWVIHAGVGVNLVRATHGDPELDAFAGDHGGASLPPTDLTTWVPWLVRHRRDELLWTKTPAPSQLDVGRTVLFGHVPDRRPWDLGHCIALDTGAGKSWADAALTAVLLPERRFIRVS